MNLKIGDKVIVKRRQCDHNERGTIVGIKLHKDIGSKNKYKKSDDVYFYSVRDEKDENKSGWSYNIFEFDKIWLDVQKTREDKLNIIGI